MNRFGKKLKNSEGVTLLFGLLALMVAAMVSVTIVAMAISSVKRVSDDSRIQQNSLLLNSAAQTFRDTLIHSEKESSDLWEKQWDKNKKNYTLVNEKKIVGKTTALGEKVITDIQTLNNPGDTYGSLTNPSESLQYVMEVSGLTRKDKTLECTVLIDPYYEYPGTAILNTETEKEINFIEIFRFRLSDEDSTEVLYLSIPCNYKKVSIDTDAQQGYTETYSWPSGSDIKIGSLDFVQGRTTQ